MQQMIPGLVALLVLALPVAAAAYTGPALGAGVIATVLAIVGTVGLAFVAVFWYPIKRVLRRRKGTTETRAAADRDDE